MNPFNLWSQDEAIRFCESVELIAPKHHCHVALTGGCLYKNGLRKDIDVLFYRVRQRTTFDRDALLAELVSAMGIELGGKKGWVRKATWHGKAIDFFFPELPAEWDGTPSEEDAYNFGVPT